MRFVLAGCETPAMRQQLIEAAYRMVGDAAEHVAEPYKRVDLYQFARGNKAAQDSRRPAPGIAPEEGPVAAAQRKTPQRSLGSVVVDRQVSIAAVPGQCSPVLQRVSNRLSGLALRQHLLANNHQISVQLVEYGAGAMLPRQTQCFSPQSTLPRHFFYSV